MQPMLTRQDGNVILAAAVVTRATLYEKLGGKDAVNLAVDKFYDKVMKQEAAIRACLQDMFEVLSSWCILTAAAVLSLCGWNSLWLLPLVTHVIQLIRSMKPHLKHMATASTGATQTGLVASSCAAVGAVS